MSKELEALENIKHYDSRVGLHEDDYAIIETTLKENEYLKTELLGLGQELNVKNKALEIIKEKRVNACEIINSKDVREYNWSIHTPKKYPLTQEEFDLLKEVLL